MGVTDQEQAKMTEQEFLSGYDPGAYERPSVTSDILVFTTKKNRLYLLMTRRSEPPFQGKWAVPGGFIRMEETAEETAVRVLREKTGVTGLYLEQLMTFSRVNRDPRMRILSVAYLGMTPKSRLPEAAGKEETALFEVRREKEKIVLLSEKEERITEEEIAFDHYEMIQTAVRRMEGKLEYTEIGFSFLEDPKAFSLTELREIYDAISGKTYDIANFRRFILKQYKETGRICEVPGESRKERGRPAVIYRTCFQ